MEGYSKVCHGGDIYRNRVEQDASINLNPLGMPEEVKKRLRDSIEHWDCYPDPECEQLRSALAAFHKVPKTWIVCANGAADLIFQAVQRIQPKRALLLTPSFAEYRQALLRVSCAIETVKLQRSNDFQADIETILAHITPGVDLFFLCNPNNPTGQACSKADLVRIADRCEQTGTWLILDECFCDLMEEPEAFTMVSELGTHRRLLILRAFTKTYAMAGLRLGYALSSEKTLLAGIAENRQPWSVSVPAQEAGLAALLEAEYLYRARRMIGKERVWLSAQLKRLGFTVFDSKINFILFYAKEHEPRALLRACLTRGILLRDCSNFDGLEPGYYRICVATPEKNQHLIQTLEEMVSGEEFSI